LLNPGGDLLRERLRLFLFEMTLKYDAWVQRYQAKRLAGKFFYLFMR